MDTVQTVLQSAKSFFAGTLFSRISGLIRDVAMAINFGSSPEIAAFFVAYRLANLFRRLLGEGNMNAAFVPHFIEMKENGSAFYRDVVFSMTFLLGFIVLFLEGLLWLISLWIGPDWAEIVHLMMWMTPGLFFICLYGLNSSLLQCRQKYFIPAAAPVVFNVIWITSAFFAPDVHCLAIAVTLAFAGQWFVTIFEGWSLLSIKEWMKPKIFSEDCKKLIKPLMLGILGIGAVQFNSALDPIFARIADLKGPAYLWYAIRVQQLPLALFGMGLTGALLPPLSRAREEGKKTELLEHALKIGIALMMIATFGICALSEEAVSLLFGHGDFSPNDVMETSRCLVGYGMGLIPSVCTLILATHCYSNKNYRLPSLASLFSVGVNVALNALFVFVCGWGTVSVAIATSVSSFVNCAILYRGEIGSSCWSFFVKLGTACLAATLITGSVKEFWLDMSSDRTLDQGAQFMLLALIFLCSICLFSWKEIKVYLMIPKSDEP